MVDGWQEGDADEFTLEITCPSGGGPGDDDDDTSEPVECGPDAPGEVVSIGAPAAMRTGTVSFEASDWGAEWGWAGCEAEHRYRTDGTYDCGVRWVVSGPYYAWDEDDSVARYELDFDVDGKASTCADTGGAEGTVYRRLIFDWETKSEGELTQQTLDERWGEPTGTLAVSPISIGAAATSAYQSELAPR